MWRNDTGVGVHEYAIAVNGKALRTDPLGWDKEVRQKLIGLYSGNLPYIFKVYENDQFGAWYKFANHDTLLSLASPVQSDMVAKTLNTLVEKVYADATITVPEKYENTFDIGFFKDFEKTIQLNGEIVVKVDYINGQPVFRQQGPDSYQKVVNSFGEILALKSFRFFSVGDEDYVLEQHIDMNKPHMYYYLYSKDDYGYDTLEDVELIPLSTFEETKMLKPFYKGQHQFAYLFNTEFKFGKVISLVEQIDETLTFIKLATRQSIPTAYVPEDVAFNPGDDSANQGAKQAVDVLYARLCGFLKIPTIDADKQKIDIVDSQIQIDNYNKVILEAKREMVEIIGLSAATMDLTEVAPDASASSINEREKKTISTRNSIIQERTLQFKRMFDDLGIGLKIDFANFGTNIEPELLLALNTMILGNNMSKQTALNLIFPHWTKEKIDAEIKRLEDLEQQHIEAQILIAGHGKDVKNTKTLSKPIDTK